MLRPWTAASFPKDRPIWVRRKGSPDGASMICAISPEGALVFHQEGLGLWVLWAELAATCEQLDGSVCGFGS